MIHADEIKCHSLLNNNYTERYKTKFLTNEVVKSNCLHRTYNTKRFSPKEYPI